MKSELQELWDKHYEEINALRKNCSHEEKYIKKSLDHSVVGCGASEPSVHVICRNCGSMKIIFGLDNKKRKTVKKSLKRQGFKELFFGHFSHSYFLETLLKPSLRHLLYLLKE